jgi:hypothetical protein
MSNIVATHVAAQAPRDALRFDIQRLPEQLG